MPFSYFWICWKVRPSCSPSFSWLIPRSIRRSRTRAPTCTSTGLARRELRSSTSPSPSAFSLDIPAYLSPSILLILRALIVIEGRSNLRKQDCAYTAQLPFEPYDCCSPLEQHTNCL